MTAHHNHLSHPKYRPDIDGLRAVAVLAVVAFHAFPNAMKGGFIGVDIFFVISGYLISTIIFENLDKGTFSFAEFYSRRIKRIFPALILVLFSCFAFGWFALLSDEFKQLGKHIAGGAAFVSNLVLWRESGYFDNTADAKPLLHLWSLSVEEQFYIVWPLLLWFAYKKRINLLSIGLLVALVSFCLNIYEVNMDAVSAFYSPQTRFWELMFGSMLAWLMLYKTELSISALSKKNTYLANSISVIALMLIVFGFWRIDKGIGFPGAWALIPVLGAVLIIYAGPKAFVNRTILSNKAVVWFGLISFPLYLWHWPLLAFARIIEGGSSSKYIRLTLIAISILFSWLTLIFVEKRIRQAVGYRYIGRLLIIATLLLLVGLYTFSTDGIPSRLIGFDSKYIAEQSRKIGWTIPAGTQEQIDNCKNKFPIRTALSPKTRDDNFCLLARNTSPDVVLIGDSLSLSLFPGISKSKDFNTLVLSASSAAPMYNIRTTEFDDTVRANNYKLTNQALDYVLSNDDVKVVVMTFLNGVDLPFNELPFKITNVDDPSETDSQKIFTSSLRRTLSKLTERNKNIIFVLPNPKLSYDIGSCLNGYRPLSFQKKFNCSQPASYHLTHGWLAYKEWVESVVKDFPNVTVYDASKPFCDENSCYGMIDGQLMYRDGYHLSDSGSDLVSNSLIPIIKKSLRH